MPVMKQKSIKPARDVPFAEGILMYNGTPSAITKNVIVRIDHGALQGSGLRMTPAQANTDAGGAKVPLFVTKHGVPAGKWGVVLPWSIIQNINTSGIANEGDAFYLQDGATGTFGPAKGTVHRAVGVCIVKHAANGIVLLSPGMFTYGTD